MSSNVFSGKSAEWYSSVMTGYIVTASVVSIGLTAVMATGAV
ncbi:hypothetical protein [Natronorubrum texcoconense]|uniref:Uncharacterized protein n=1 Tax=Natronorubrum texcoconense TaxID=1095776 RepID=A0A1G9E3P2_9EURY|nr:hypothetical protein [Natronorubrum texcoconense]SDK70756.1 hypothetical protein SAMN04515672_3746 [Natronorubrum texcoconense]